jgi:hypothetical protein
MQGAGIFGAGALGFGLVVAVGLIDDHAVDHFDDAPLHALQLVACAGQHKEQEEIGHRAHCGLGLADADSFDEDVLIPGSLAQENRFAGTAGDAAQMAAGGRRADECTFFHGETLHAGLVTENTTSGDGARGVDAKHGEPLAALVNEVPAECIDERAFAGSGDARDSDPPRTAGVGEHGIEQAGGEIGIAREIAFDQCDSAGEDNTVAGEDAVNVAVKRQTAVDGHDRQREVSAVSIC